MGDSDQSYDFSRLMPFLEQLRAGADLVMGNRFAGGIEPGAMPWKNRHIGNPVLSGVGRFLFKCPARDFHCGIRGFSVDAFRRMDLRTTGMEFASEMVIKATLLEMRVVEVPTTLRKDGRSRPPHLRPWRDGWRHLRFMLLYSPNWLFLYPGAALALVGLAVVLCMARVRSAASSSTCDALRGAGGPDRRPGDRVCHLLEDLRRGGGAPPRERPATLVPPWATLEAGLVVGGLLVAAGLGGSLWACGLARSDSARSHRATRCAR